MADSHNDSIARLLREMADVLELQNANPFRIKAYEQAANTVSHYPVNLESVLEAENIEGLVHIPTIGRGIASAIAEIISTGRFAQLERLRGTLNPAQLFQTVPGIGPVLAKRIHETLHIDSLEDLESAIHDGRIEQVKGFSSRRVDALVPALSAILTRNRRRSAIPSTAIPVSRLLALDEDYRVKAGQDKLPLITPRRFNPERIAWLPVMHESNEQWHFTVLFSNSALAHKLHRNADWVIIYFYDHDHREGQHTVVTETQGELTGKRVVRGRERECVDYYRAKEKE